MPCDCSHLMPQELEKEISKVCCLLDEVMDGKPIDKCHFNGYHPLVYNQPLPRNICDFWTARLCRLLSNHKDVSSLSLEAQIWWRDHQAADVAKEAARLAAKEGGSK